jgi:hypothetical protein
MLLRQPAQGERWLALLKLGADIAHGVLPEALSADYLAKAIANRDRSPAAISAHAIAYWVAFNRRKDEDAAPSRNRTGVRRRFIPCPTGPNEECSCEG